MRSYKIFLIVILSFLWVKTISAEEKISGGINKEQPISIGEDVYYRIANISKATESSYTWILRDIVYKYVGIENGNLKIEMTVSDSSTSNRVGTTKTTILLLPLSIKKQAILKVRTFSEPGTADLILTIIDDFNRIDVEEVNK